MPSQPPIDFKNIVFGLLTILYTLESGLKKWNCLAQLVTTLVSYLMYGCIQAPEGLEI